jgi:hypothetical protein
MPQPPQKRRLKDLKGPLAEPPRTPARLIAFAEGVARFDAGAYWDAHEAWERAWLDFGNGPEDDAEIVLRGLIQLAAALHQAQGAKGGQGGRSNLDKAAPKLKLWKGPFWGVDLNPVNRAVADAKGDPSPLLGLTLGGHAAG